ncbi:MAG: hypothetical protein H7Z14_16100 [Anaerolineae bacterium]|nr:hypothetical protein [Phycisphaerae bacterium]
MLRTKASFNPVQILESRILLAAVPPDTVLVRASDASDLITLQVRLASNGAKELRATINGRVRRFNLTGINTISVESLSGNDQIFVNENTVRPIVINGGLGDDTIVGGAGNDRIIGGRGRDLISGNDGDDLIKGYDSDDTLNGNDGNDVLDGGAGADFMLGGNGNDVLIGGTGSDQMFGQNGNDTFFAIDGTLDTISGGSGDDSFGAVDLIDSAT